MFICAKNDNIFCNLQKRKKLKTEDEKRWGREDRNECGREGIEGDNKVEENDRGGKIVKNNV
jgi:hypothetical protein